MVAWTPDCSVASHTSRPSGTYAATADTPSLRRPKMAARPPAATASQPSEMPVE